VHFAVRLQVLFFSSWCLHVFGNDFDPIRTLKVLHRIGEKVLPCVLVAPVFVKVALLIIAIGEQG